MSTPSLKVVVAITSPIAFQSINDKTILETSLGIARSFASNTSFDSHVVIATTDAAPVSHLGVELLICDPTSPASLASAIAGSGSCDLLVIHDAQRPLTTLEQFNRVVAALQPSIDAVRPAAPFTETLKVVRGDLSIDRTIDRTSMQRISTPELIRYSAIDFAGESSNWFVPLVSGAVTVTVDSQPSSLRVNSEAEIALLNSLI